MTLPKKPRIRRNWERANEEKRASRCRACGREAWELERKGRVIELAHVAGQKYDLTPAIGYEEIPILRSNLWVAPTRVIPLCGPSTDTGTCHNLHHAARLDLLPHLTRAEEVQAVADLGLYRAYMNLGGGIELAPPTRTETR